MIWKLPHRQTHYTVNAVLLWALQSVTRRRAVKNNNSVCRLPAMWENNVLSALSSLDHLFNFSNDYIIGLLSGAPKIYDLFCGDWSIKEIFYQSSDISSVLYCAIRYNRLSGCLRWCNLLTWLIGLYSKSFYQAVNYDLTGLTCSV